MAAQYSEDVQHRLNKWEEFAALQPAQPEPQTIKVSFLDGKTVEGTSFKTTPMELLKQHYPDLAKTVIVANVDGVNWDLLRPLEKDCLLQYFDFESKMGKYVFWHSSAHILGQAIELVFPNCRLTIGPPIEDGGFYYDVLLPDGKVFTTEDIPKVQDTVNKIIKEKQNFSRLVLTKDQALSMFSGNKFKEQIIGRIPAEELTTAYKNGPLIDLCRGPHILNTGKVMAMKVTRSSSAYWMGYNTQDSLQRIYGISFPSKKE